MEHTTLAVIKEKLTPEVIPYPYNEWAKIVGAENLYEFALNYGGATLYIPKPEHIIREARNNLIKQEFNGFNHKELAKKYRLTEEWIRRICKNEEDK
jgi:Mor family transcriptional regulator